MKRSKLILLSLSCIVLLSGCGKEKEEELVVDTLVGSEEIQESIENSLKIIKPLPSVIDINNLKDCTLSVEITDGSIYYEESTNSLKLKANVYEHEVYDMVDILLLEVGNTIEIGGENIEINSLETTELGTIIINGGLDVGGYELITSDNTVYYSIEYSDYKKYRYLGEVELVVADDFMFYDNSDLDKDSLIYNIDNFLMDEDPIDYKGNQHNTVIVIDSNGEVLSMTRSYLP